MNNKYVNVALLRPVHKKLRLRAFREGVSMGALVEQMLKERTQTKK